MPVFECSYADVPLDVPTPEVLAWAERAVSLCDLRDVQPPARFPGKNLRGLAWENPTTYPATRVGQLFWPCGASRWAVGHFLADGAMVQKIKNKVIPSNFTGANLVLRCNDGDSDNPDTGITAKMYCLPPRPLGGLVLDTSATGTERDLYLLTLVDVRYYWQHVPITWDGESGSGLTGSGLSGSGEGWAEYYAMLASALGVSLSPGPIEGVYGEPEPDSSLFVNAENAALVLDAVLANTGRVLAANYDGTFTVQKIVTARDAAKDQRAKRLDKPGRTAGGPVLALNANTSDVWRKAVLPTTVKVTFPTWVNDQGYFKPSPQYRSWVLDSYNGVYTSSVDLSSLGSYYASMAGTAVNWTKVFHDTAKARYTGSPSGGTPTNQTDLDNLAKQLAKDYVDGLIARLDEVYPGVVPWTPDGLNDLLFAYRTETATTRVQGKPFNSGVEEMQHGFGPLDSSDCCVALVRVVNPVPMSEDECGSGSGDLAGVIECALEQTTIPPPPFSLGPVYDAILTGGPSPVPIDVEGFLDWQYPHPTFVPSPDVGPVWLLQINGTPGGAGLKADGTYFAKKIGRACFCGEVRDVYMTDETQSSDDPAGGFWAIVEKSSRVDTGSGDCVNGGPEDTFIDPLCTGSGTDRPTCPRGYGFSKVVFDLCGVPFIAEPPQNWAVRGDPCCRQAYEVMNRQDVPNGEIVWMRRADIGNGMLYPPLAPKPQPPIYLFKYEGIGDSQVSGSGSGSGCVGVPISALFDCDNLTIRDGCIAIVGGKLVVVDGNDNVIAGG